MVGVEDKRTQIMAPSWILCIFLVNVPSNGTLRSGGGGCHIKRALSELAVLGWLSKHTLALLCDSIYRGQLFLTLLP